ncbi:MAG TPA: hypothetical protein VIF15_02705 [Polyangiaceae bacterium]|jgi:hypothetical protein
MPNGKSTKAALAEQLIAGTKKHFANTASLVFDSASYTPAQIEASFQTLVDLRTAVVDAKAATATKVAAEKDGSTAILSLMTAYVAFVKSTFAKSPDVLADFGLKPKKVPTPLTVEEKAAAVAKRKATRASRKTMGSRQKKAVKGTVATVVVTPVHAELVDPGPAHAPNTGASGGSNTHGA